MRKALILSSNSLSYSFHVNHRNHAFLCGLSLIKLVLAKRRWMRACWRRRLNREVVDTAVEDGSDNNGGQGFPEGCCVEGSGWEIFEGGAVWDEISFGVLVILYWTFKQNTRRSDVFLPPSAFLQDRYVRHGMLKYAYPPTI
jgi:hypothetical protein